MNGAARDRSARRATLESRSAAVDPASLDASGLTPSPC
jgi:hypothetical protein